MSSGKEAAGSGQPPRLFFFCRRVGKEDTMWKRGYRRLHSCGPLTIELSVSCAWFRGGRECPSTDARRIS